MDGRLRHAIAVARQGTFSRAAKEIGLTQSALTRSVAHLERQVGYALFLRTSKGVFPTADGRDFLERATRIVADIGDLLAVRRPYRLSRTADVAVCVSASSGQGTRGSVIRAMLPK